MFGMAKPKLNPPTEWDKKLINALLPLAKAGWIHHTVFFANTFPLGFHYAWALKQAGKENQIKECLKISGWKPSSIEDENKAFYYDVREDSKRGVFIPVTIFQPKYVFIQRTLATTCLAEDVIKEIKARPIKKKKIGDVKKSFVKNNPPLPLKSFLQKAKDFDTVEIYAEIDVLGEYLRSKITSEITDKTCRVYHAESGERLPLIEPFARGNSTLRLFIYGGSLTTYLKRKKNHYITTEVDSGKNSDEKKLATGIRLVGTANATIKKAIRTYHKLLYDAADPKRNKNLNNAMNCPPFYSVCRAYNTTAWLNQHRSTFKEPSEYAVCLEEHHKKYVK